AENRRAAAGKGNPTFVERTQKPVSIGIPPLPSVWSHSNRVQGTNVLCLSIGFADVIEERNLEWNGDARAFHAHGARKRGEVVGIGSRKREVNRVAMCRSKRGIVHRR